MAIGVAAAGLAVWVGLGRRPGGPAPSPAESPDAVAEERAEPAPGVTGERLARGILPPGGAGVGPPIPSRPPSSRWDHRLRTNGIVDPARAIEDEEYSRLVRKHRRIKALLVSPARETPECAAIVALTERLGLPVAAVPDLYNALWELQAAERAAARPDGGGNPEARQATAFVGQLAWEDFQIRFTRDLGIPAEPVFQELAALNLHPTVFFGVPDALPTRASEALLVED